ncbi:PREDICTED: zinc finger CCCH domain-containing protein 14 [Nelumbo nucifera]|uniref:Zinc finger CCCH domain-containing protein 14 n=1 Tax=Nelumbo nucifera TaxID=4432 RepID=A0A1U8BAX7_NELNU|nr:PREDICTED: zinc finger CCCH domain-containing protein 14 [Nelumbo nucifera]
MEIFSANPRSFKIDRRSPLASKLKVSVSEKLLEFLGNYTDDVLAEYIIVLVCNGKHQIQARDDLEAFLGERSGEFVSWLWGVLLKHVHQSSVPVGSSDLKCASITSIPDDNADKEHEISTVDGLQNHATIGVDRLPGKDKKCEHSSLHDLEVPEDLQHSCSNDATVNEIKPKAQQAQTCLIEVPKKYGATKNQALKYGSSRVRCPSGNLHISMESHYSKPSMTDAAETRLSSRSVDAVCRRSARPRGNVWDRLGKPCEDNTIVREENIDIRGVDFVKRETSEHSEEGHCQGRVMPFVRGGRLGGRATRKGPLLEGNHANVISNTSHGDYGIPDDGVKKYALHDGTNLQRKRQFGEINPASGSNAVSFVETNERHPQHKEKFKEFQRPSSVCQSQMLTNALTETRKPDSLEKYHAPVSDTALDPRANKISQAKLTREGLEGITQTLASVNCLLASKSVPANNENSVNANTHPMQAEILDVKLRLREIEVEMSKLRQMHVDVKNDGNLNLSMSSGGSNHPEEDIESRTVFVTNVHFAATKEALSMHFSKCGVVIKVVILVDRATGQPKGSAYISFADKESVDRALALSGTSFLSRSLKIVRKTDMPTLPSVPSQISGMPSQTWFPQNRKGMFHRPYPSSHLHWQRDLQANVEGSISIRGGASEAPGAVKEQFATDSSSQPCTHSLVT